MKRFIDINCDLGESILSQDWAKDELLMPYISSCNIACGGHAGNKQSITTSILNAKKHSLNIGAHPSFPDKENFGRKALSISSQELQQSIRQQLTLFNQICQENSCQMHHVKPHGALYNQAAQDLKLALMIAEEVANIVPNAVLVGLASSTMAQAAERFGLIFWHEGFMDRNYQADAALVPRNRPDALHSSETQSLQQALNLAQGKPIDSLDGSKLLLDIDTICLHGDNPNALNIAKQLSQTLYENNIIVGHDADSL